MKTRMQPIGNAWSKFPRLIRDLTHDLGKKIELKMHGAETELDRQLLEMIKDPLTHMVRNSCDHGLEMPDDRTAAGKSDTGTVTLSAYHEGGHIIIDIIDDGKGLNVERIKEKAIENGITTPTELESLSDQQIMQFIFRAGFSTADKVTSVSGRGVGMDVVRTNIEKIGGTIELSSELGKGSKFSIKIPLTLAIVSVLSSRHRGRNLPYRKSMWWSWCAWRKILNTILKSLTVRPSCACGKNFCRLACLSEMLHLPVDAEQSAKPWNKRDAFVMVCKVGGYDFGLVVDKVFDTEEIVVKPVSSLLKNISVYSGNTILGDGSVILILDPNGLARSLGEVDLSGHKNDYGSRADANAAALSQLPAVQLWQWRTQGRAAGAGLPPGRN